MAGKDFPKQITNFDELVEAYEHSCNHLKSKDAESYWLRYLFRRIPIFASTGLIFFGICFAITLTENFGTKKIDEFLLSLRLFDVGYRDHILIGSFFLLLLRSLLPWKWFANKKTTQATEEQKTKNWRKIWSEKLEKPIALLLISSMLLSGFSWIIAQNHTLLLGLTIFSVVTLGTLLADRTLGFTRRNERYKLFSMRAEGLILETNSRKQIKDTQGKPIEFNEEHLLECLAFFEELRLDKYNATMSDSFYLLRLKQRLLRYMP